MESLTDPQSIFDLCHNRFLRSSGSPQVRGLPCSNSHRLTLNFFSFLDRNKVLERVPVFRTVKIPLMLPYFTTFVLNDVITNISGPEEAAINAAVWHFLSDLLYLSVPCATWEFFSSIPERSVQDLRYHEHVRPLPSVVRCYLHSSLRLGVTMTFVPQ